MIWLIEKHVSEERHWLAERNGNKSRKGVEMRNVMAQSCCLINPLFYHISYIFYNCVSIVSAIIPIFSVVVFSVSL